jgi:glyoxylase-like metal-dependent hydrolase (beta-lactamase superfamily II)
MGGEHAARRLAGAGPQLQDGAHPRPDRGFGGLVLKALVRRHLGAHELEVAVGAPMELTHARQRTLRDVAAEVAPGIHRLGNELVNFFLVEDDGGLTLVDAGLPGFLGQVEALLGERGRALSDADAVILTHAHVDHVGVAEAVRSAGVPVYVHEADAEMARTGKTPKRERAFVPYLRHPATWKLLAASVRAGGLKPAKIAEVSTFSGDTVLEVPGRPQAIHTPGHSDGHVVFHLADRGALLVGDALCTYNPLTGRRGPQLMPGGFSVSSPQAMDSLSRIEGLEASVLLPGHGEPWTDGVAAAVARAREAGPS